MIKISCTSWVVFLTFPSILRLKSLVRWRILYMFETGFGRELRHLLCVVSPLDGSKVWSLIEVYVSAVRVVTLTWFDGITQCFDREIKNVGDFIIATQPMLLQNPDAFSMPTVLSYSQQASLLMSIIKLSCHDGAGWHDQQRQKRIFSPVSFPNHRTCPSRYPQASDS